ncbi:MAG: transglutaminase-like domain-containing protein [Candidatus Levybacteria bacterium]|nr:transglutaminase-like domain-containing protein [Candidatus Levybacteria bacterium]
MNKYLKFGKYTRDCPQWLLDKAKAIDDSKIDKAYIKKILWVIRDEFNSKKHNTTCTNDFRQSRFISVTDILEKRQTSCGSLSTVIASVLRNLKIPTKLANGLYIESNPNMRHAWNEVYLNKRWVPFDITKKGFEIGKYHIRKDEWVDWEDLEKVYKPEQ